MSSSEQVREPAWSALEPAPYRVHPVGDAWAKRVLSAVGRPGLLLAREDDPARPARYYQFIPEDPSPTLFLKTIDNAHLESQLQADRIARWLDGRGIPASPLRDSYPRRLNPEYQLLAYRHIDARFARPDTTDLAAIGHLLGQVHQALRALPWAGEIQADSARRDARFEHLRAAARQQPDCPAVLRSTHTTLPQDDAQVIHGDLNIGNLLCGRHTGRPTLIDFEDARHNWHSPLVDLAMALERFVLVREADDSRAYPLGVALLDAYHAASDHQPTLQRGGSAILQSLAARSLLLLGQLPESASTRSETTKFLQLHQQAGQRRPLLEALWDHLAAC